MESCNSSVAQSLLWGDHSDPRLVRQHAPAQARPWLLRASNDDLQL